MRAFPRLVAVVAAVLASGATAAEGPFRLGPDPVLGGGEYSVGGGITVAVELRRSGGDTVLCGAWAQSEQLTALLSDKGNEILAKGKITLGAEVLTHNLNFLRRIAPRPGYAGAPAGCVRLDRAWRAGDAARPLKVRIPRRELRVGGGVGRAGGGAHYTFRDTGKLNPAMGAGGVLPARWTRFHLTPTRSQ